MWLIGGGPIAWVAQWEISEAVILMMTVIEVVRRVYLETVSDW
jgi:hypothetical protein